MFLLVPAMLATTFINTATAQDSPVVNISTALDPSVVTIEVGTSVTWTNIDGREHQMRSETGPAEFDTDDLEPGASATITFTVEGIYTYADHNDPENHEYQGTLVVVPVGDAPWFPGPGDAGTPPPPPPPTEATVGMAGRVFRPATLTVGVGATVTFFNDDGRTHTATANDFSWDSGNFDPGQSYQKTFNTPGTVGYFCVIHPDMIGTIVVAGGDGSAPAPPPTTAPDPTPAAPIPATSQQVEIIDFDYSPTALTIAAGASVTWRNTGPTPHTVTSDVGAFDSGYMFTTDTYTSTFPEAGTFNYYCTLHPEMRAAVIVGAGGAVPDSSTAVDTDGSNPTAPPTAALGGLSVTMLDNNFSPQSITVTAGTTVRWGNNGQALHTVTANDGSFDSGFIDAGRTYARRFPTPGTFSYVCIIHPGMTGTVLVTDSAGTAPPPEAEPAIVESDEAATATPDSGTPDSFRINVIDLDYDPRDLTVPVGTEVLWVNTGQAPHTVTDNNDELVDSGIFMPGESFTLLFDQEGVFDYYCTLHPGMEGRVTITEGADVAFAEKNVPKAPAPPQAADSPASDIVALDVVQHSAGINGAATAISMAAALGALALGYLALRDWVKLPKTPL